MSSRDLSPEGFSRIAIPVVRCVAGYADQFRPNKSDAVVGEVVAAVHAISQAHDLDDDQRIVLLEAEIVALATLIYRDHQTEFEQFVSESAELVVLNALIKMRDQTATTD